MRLASVVLCLGLALAAPATAGVLDDLKSSATSVRDTIKDVKSTKDETKGIVTDADDLADETKGEVESVTPKPAAPPPPPPSASAPPPPPPPPSATEWHIDLGGGQTRRVNQSELTNLIQSGQVHAETPVFTSALGSWQPAGQVPALKGYFK
jgi:hypothetical protein